MPGDLMRTVDQAGQVGPEKVRTLLTEEVGISAEQAEEILRFMAIRGDVLPCWNNTAAGAKPSIPG